MCHWKRACGNKTRKVIIANTDQTKVAKVNAAYLCNLVYWAIKKLLFAYNIFVNFVFTNRDIATHIMGHANALIISLNVNKFSQKISITIPKYITFHAVKSNKIP